MDLITVREIYRDRDKFLGKEIQIGGWVRSIRDSKTFGFIVVSDGSYFDTLQVVYHDNMENFNEISRLNVGAAILVKGTLVATPEAKQPFEIQADEVIVEGASSPDYPLQKKRHSLEYLRTISHLRPRTNTFQAVFRVRSLIAYAIHQYFQERDFVYVHRKRLRGSRRDVPGNYHGFKQCSEDRRRQGGFLPGLLRQAYEPDCKRPVKRRDLRYGLPQHLHLRTDLPRRELQHYTPCG